MKTFVFVSTKTNSLLVTIYSENLDNAWLDLKNKLEILEKEDIFMPRVNSSNWRVFKQI